MKYLRFALSIFVLAVLGNGPVIASNPFDRPANFTLNKKVPHGCFGDTPVFTSALQPSRWIITNDVNRMLVDETIAVDDENRDGTNLRIRMWRLGCHEPGRSAIMLNFNIEEGPINSLDMPFIRLSVPGSEDDFIGNTSLHSSGIFDSFIVDTPSLAELTELEDDGITYILDSWSSGLSVEQYNSDLDVEMLFPGSQTFETVIPAYDPEMHLTSFRFQDFSGRHSGQWVAEGLPRTGLVLQVGEIAPERNFIFAIWFTYLDGEPIWLAGNTDISRFGDYEATIDLFSFEGGNLITDTGSYTAEQVSNNYFGTMNLRVIHCNLLEADIDFSDTGFGIENGLQLTRLVRIAGYDCDQTQ